MDRAHLGNYIGGAGQPAENGQTRTNVNPGDLSDLGPITPWNFPLAIPMWKTLRDVRHDLHPGPRPDVRALERLEAGMLHVNRPGVGAYAHLPHVGAKASQLGPPECSPQVWDFYTGWRSASISY